MRSRTYYSVRHPNGTGYTDNPGDIQRAKALAFVSQNQAVGTPDKWTVEKARVP